MSARSKWLELAKWCEQQSRKANATDARSKREERAFAYRGRMYARIATYIRQHPELPAVQPPPKAKS